MSEDFGKITRLRDLYRVHDASKKQKKERRAQDEEEFLRILEDSEKNLEEFDEKNLKKESPKQNAPHVNMLERLSSTAPKFQIKEIEQEEENQ